MDYSHVFVYLLLLNPSRSDLSIIAFTMQVFLVNIHIIMRVAHPAGRAVSHHYRFIELLTIFTSFKMYSILDCLVKNPDLDLICDTAIVRHLLFD